MYIHTCTFDFFLSYFYLSFIFQIKKLKNFYYFLWFSFKCLYPFKLSETQVLTRSMSIGVCFVVKLDEHFIKYSHTVIKVSKN